MTFNFFYIAIKKNWKLRKNRSPVTKEYDFFLCSNKKKPQIERSLFFNKCPVKWGYLIVKCLVYCGQFSVKATDNNCHFLRCSGSSIIFLKLILKPFRTIVVTCLLSHFLSDTKHRGLLGRKRLKCIYPVEPGQRPYKSDHSSSRWIEDSLRFYRSIDDREGPAKL